MQKRNKRGLHKRTAAKAAERRWIQCCQMDPEARYHKHAWYSWEQEDDDWLESVMIHGPECEQLSREDSEPIWPPFHGFPSSSSDLRKRKASDQLDETGLRRSSRRLALKKEERVRIGS